MIADEETLNVGTRLNVTDLAASTVTPNPSAGQSSVYFDTETKTMTAQSSAGVLYSWGKVHRRVVAAATATILIDDQLLSVTYSTTGTSTINLPAASTVAEGQVFYVVDEGGNASDFPISIVPNGADTFNGGTLVLIDQDYMSISFYCDGVSCWFIM